MLMYAKLECQYCKGTNICSSERGDFFECRDCGQRSALAAGVVCKCHEVKEGEVCPTHGKWVRLKQI